MGGVDRPIPHPDPHRSIPDYLQPFIVEQELSRYSAIDQAVWRFVLLQLRDLLERTAHASYVQGLARTAISAERIPSIEEMNHALGAIGWQAVCVDGFIPPRAFQAFQSLSVLPIAAEIRSVEHLPYTPAPDIIHEAAGHAPILIDPHYADYVRAAGEVAARAFSSPADGRVDRAVRTLSALKELKEPKAEEVRAAEHELERAIASVGAPSEAARVARLYWWTAEYGLVGTLEDYRLYGAGLLSSLGESHFCHRPSVLKRRLTAECTSVGYDITRPQPQLFVAEDFEHLHAVLSEVSQTLAYDIGGARAVHAALQSQELCTVYLPGGAQVIGTLGDVSGDDAAPLLGFPDGASLAQRGRLLGPVRAPYVVPVGRLADGSDPRALAPRGARPARASSGRIELRYASGVRVSGRPAAGPWTLPDAAIWLEDFRLEHGDRAPLLAERYPLLLADRVITAGAGSACPEVSPLGESKPPSRSGRARVPKLRQKDARTLELERLYAEAAAARARVHGGATPNLAGLVALHAELEREYPHDWLVRWNLLECLIEMGARDTQVARALGTRLMELEEHYRGEHPIAMGIEYLERARAKP